MPFLLAGMAPTFVRAAKPRGAASVRVPRPEIGELAHQAQGAGTFAVGEYTAEGVGSVDRFEPAKCIF